jgi:uncharacterized protein YjiS (DUF1127 family)
MIDQPTQEQPKAQGKKKVAVACQGGGIHTSFAVGVLTEILRDIQQNNRFDLMGLSGTSGGALCTLMVWYGLAQKNGRPGSEQEAIYCAQFLAGIEEARAMAFAYQNLAKLSDRELAARGLSRADIPRAVLAAFNRG